MVSSAGARFYARGGISGDTGERNRTIHSLLRQTEAVMTAKTYQPGEPYTYPLLLKKLLTTPLIYSPDREIVYRDRHRITYRPADAPDEPGGEGRGLVALEAPHGARCATSSASKFCSCGCGFQPRSDRGKMPLPQGKSLTYLKGDYWRLPAAAGARQNGARPGHRSQRGLRNVRDLPDHQPGEPQGAYARLGALAPSGCGHQDRPAHPPRGDRPFRPRGSAAAP